MFTGKTKNLAVMGWPVAHSLSPVLQMAAIQQAGLDYAYITLPVRPEDLEDAVKGLRAMQFRGWNITIPHKQATMAYLDEVDEDARIIGAVNTIVNEDGRLKGYNTDFTGSMWGLLNRGFDPDGKKAVLLGAGGAARALIWGLIKHGIDSICIGARNPAKVAQLAQEFSKYTKVESMHWETDEFRAVLRDADLLINTTPLGMAPKTEAMPPVDWADVKASAFVYDVIYTPLETMFLRTARENGHETLNGEAMLVGQGADSLKLWTGIEPDRAVMSHALHTALTTK